MESKFYAMDSPKDVLKRLGIPEKQAAELLSISRTKSISRGEDYISAGQTPKTFAIVINGLFRYYYIDEKGNEFTKGFIPAATVLSAYSAMRYETSSFFYIQALEDSEILEIDYKKWLLLQQEDSFWDKFLIQALEKGYFIKEKRERELLLLDAEARYKIFTTEFPDLEKRIKLQIVASYLGIQPESLSRIRKNKPA
ncbi:Crp/Fnr family transcriptional regulator [Flavobacterium lindanitolerans]|uniref:Crp/Fnr family transcriptional regulator n=1 Tax=Flavobacterium lindanitolerans TaxID=428988 RepID=UPI0031DE1490